MMNLICRVIMREVRSSMPALLSMAMTIAVMATTTARAQPCDPVETDKLLASGWAFKSFFGYSVAMSGDTAVMGAYGNDDKGEDAGAAFIYRFDGMGWFEEARLYASDASANSWFGFEVALSDDITVVSGGNAVGSAYVFRFDDGQWVEEAKLSASDGELGDEFGNRIAVTEGIIVFGVYKDDDKGDASGSVYVFRFDGAEWIEEAKLLASDGEAFDWFGRSVSISGDTLLIGANYDDDHGDDAGAVYVFEYNGSQWVEADKLIPASVGQSDNFGCSIALEGDKAAIGARRDDGRGSIFVYRYDGIQWTEEAKLSAFDGKGNDYLGGRVALSGNTIVATAYGADDLGERSGAAYVFRYDDGQWIGRMKLLASDGAEDDIFGFDVGISRDTAIIGAPVNSENGTASGAAYVFALGCDCLDLRVDNLIAGEQAVFTIAGGSPNKKGVTVYGTKAGKTTLNGYAGFCATFGIVGITQNKIIGGINRIFDNNGRITFGLTIPRNVAGTSVFFQTAQGGTCPDECVSNLVQAVIQ